MNNLIKRLYEQKQIECPPWLPDNLIYLTIMGSRAYACNTEESDYDYYGCAIPPKVCIFPGSKGLILGFDNIPIFEQYKKDHFIDYSSNKDMEITVYGLVRYFRLLMDGNPNVIESLFTERECVIYSTPMAEEIRANRTLFLSKSCFFKTRNYAFSQLKKLDRTPDVNGKRYILHQKFGYDTKFASSIVRLIDNCEQIAYGNLDLRRNKEMVKTIRQGEWSLTRLREYVHDKESQLHKVIAESSLPEQCNIDEIRILLLKCLESHYGCLDKEVMIQNREQLAIAEIQQTLRKFGL